MTQEDAHEIANGDEAEVEKLKYRIDLQWYEASARSFQDMIASRLNEMDHDAPQDSKKQKGHGVPSMVDLAKIEGFVNPALPLLEAAFRLLLVHENKPMDVEQLGEELAERGVGIRDSRVITPKTLVRVLDNDNYYGIRRV
jgi:hypothetical protein